MKRAYLHIHIDLKRIRRRRRKEKTRDVFVFFPSLLILWNVVKCVELLHKATREKRRRTREKWMRTNKIEALTHKSKQTYR
jgi:hypothetical protein